jgi:hypothetical protein
LCSSARIRRSAVRGERKGLTERREGMRGEKEIREALKRLKDEHLRRMRQPDSYSPYVDSHGWYSGMGFG